MRFSRFRRAREEIEVDLIPVMNLFVTLIPFLLLAAAFYHVGVIPASLPSQTDKASDIAAEKRSVTVNLLIEPRRIHISASNAVLDEAELAELSMTLEKEKDGFDLELLGKALYEIKRRYEESDTIVVLPTDTVEYQDVVQILDAAREFKVKKDGKEKPTPLFPVVVLSRKV
jgi:biopolymer transport protein ExbD